jgi:hypothetical protein
MQALLQEALAGSEHSSEAPGGVGRRPLSVHLRIARANAAAEVVELHVRMIGKK